MNNIEKMLEELCPEGVEYVKLGEVFEFRNGYTPSKNVSTYWEGGAIPWFRMEDIRKKGRILSDSILHITPEAVKGGKLFPANSFIIATTATIGEHALIVTDSLANQQFTNLVIRESLLSRVNVMFLYYYLFIIGEKCKDIVNAGGFASVDMKKFRNLPIPLPPLPIQEEIVRILDKFTALTAKLQAELQAELEARQKQYEYYRDKLLSFNEIGGVRKA